MTQAFCPHCMADVSAERQSCTVCGLPINTQDSAHHLPVGTVLQNEKGRRYLFGEVKGGGGFGLTYIARELASGQVVAIKEYYPTRCQPERQGDGSIVPLSQMQSVYDKGKQSFLSEASMLLAVQEIPHIVHVLDFFQANHTAYMVMEYLDGTTLRDMMQRQSRFEPTMLLRKMLLLMEDIDALHKAGVIHRDIAPDNIMVMPDGSLKLLDFGCARSMEDGRSMTVLIKPGFAPVEQYTTKGQGPYSDIYSLCGTIYYCLSGKLPAESPARASAASEGKEDPLRPLSSLGVDISPELESLLLWGLAWHPNARPQAMEQLAGELKKRLPQPAPVTAPSPNLSPGASPAPDAAREHASFLREHGAAAAIAVIALLLIVLAFLR